MANVPPHCECSVLEKGFPLKLVHILGHIISQRIHVYIALYCILHLNGTYIMTIYQNQPFM